MTGVDADGPGTPPDLTLRDLLSHDEDAVLRLVLAPSGRDVPLRGLIVGDEGGERPYRDRIVLVTGSATDAGSDARAVREAAARGAAAVVVRGRGAEPPAAEVVAAARAADVALLVRAGWADWADTIAVLRSAFAFAAAGADRPDGDDAGEDGLAELADTVARQCGASITVEDTRFRVVAHSRTGPDADPVRRSTILTGRMPDARVARLRSSGLLRALWTSRDVIHRPADAADPERLVVAVRSGDEILGSLWAAADGHGFSPDAREALRRAAEVAVPHLLRHRLRASGARRREEHALRGLLSGDDDGRAHVWSLGLAPELPCVVLVAEQDPTGSGPPARALQTLALQATAHRPGVRVLRESGRLTVLLPVPDGDPRAALVLARELDAAADTSPGAPAVWIGAGPLVDSPLDAHRSREEAGLVVRALRERAARSGPPEPPGPAAGGGRGGVADGDVPDAGEDRGTSGLDGSGRRRPVRYAGPDDVAQTVAVLRVLDAIRPLWDARGGPVHAMVTADLAAGGELVRSLGAYLDAAGDVPSAARRLVLHPNTLRYRLRRVRERFGIDLDDPDTRLLVTLAVRLIAARPAPPSR